MCEFQTTSSQRGLSGVHHHLWEFLPYTNATGLSPLPTKTAPKSILGRVSDPSRVAIQGLPTLPALSL